MKHYGAVDDPKDITTKEYVDAADNALKVKVDALWDFVCTDITSNPFQVALLAEGVDRNRNQNVTQPTLVGRPPRGGRG